MKQRILDWYYTFPIQLLVLHMRSNIFFLFLWLITLALATGAAGLRFGWMYLFLTPEYLEEVGFWSFMIVGVAFGGFVVTWNVTSYILHSPHFPFLASLQRPFTKFFMNNGLIPLGFLFIYVCSMIRHQWYYECWSGGDIFYNMLGFIFGFSITLILTIIYFQYTNKDIFSFKDAIIRPPNLDKPVIRGNKTATIENITSPEFTKVRSYLNDSFRWRPVRNVAHYEEHYLYKVFRQNHFNAVVVQCVSIMLLIFTGYMIENPYFRLPAAASFFIFLSVIASIAALLFYWLHKWTNLFIVALVLIVNTITKFDVVEFKNRAFGLEYDKAPLEYSYEVMDSIHQDKFVKEDKEAMKQILENWKAKIPKGKLREKPKMVLVGTSGGGLRAGLWTMQVLQQADKITNGKFMNHTSMVTGASGGMFALGYYRELYLKKNQGDTIQLDNQIYLDNMGKDLLNSIMYTMVSNDIFMPWSKFEINGQRYPKDRGYMFEKQFNQNTDGLIDKPLGYYKSLEESADIPMMILAPVIVNDGRKLMISPLGMSHLCQSPHGVKYKEIGHDAIDFGRYFQDRGADQLRFTTAIRANASFPYVLPNVALPTEPRIELADAGFMDNMGIGTILRFLHVYQDWIKENTSGVAIVVIRGSEAQDKPINERQGLIEAALNPVIIMRRIVDIQDFEHDNSLSFIMDIFGEDFVDFIPFTYFPDEGANKASMNLHLTNREKIDVINSFYQDHNQESMKRLKEVLR